MCAVFRQGVASGNLVDSYDFTTGAGTVNVAAAARIGYTSGNGHRTELTFFVQPDAPGGNTTGKPVLTYDDTSNASVTHAFSEFSDIVTVSAVDRTGTASNAGTAGTTSITVTTTTHTQADTIAVYAFADKWNYVINGDNNTGAVPSGSGFTVLYGQAANTVLSFMAAYKVLSATTALSLESTFVSQDDEGQVAGVIVLKGASSSLRVEVTGFDSAVTTGITVDDVGVWVGNVFTTTADGHYEDVAFNNDGSIYLEPAPAGTVADQVVNVILDDATTTSGAVGIVQGVVKAYTP